MENFGQIFGMVFTAFGFVSGALGPWLGGFLLDVSEGNFTLVFAYLGILLTVSVFLIWIVSPRAECTF
jgi:OFA family oxalate/formate antiporter-like MFS transporter